jgi:hypothetical protein
MDKIALRAAARAFMRSSQPDMPPPDQMLPRTTRERPSPRIEDAAPRARRVRTPPPVDQARAREACSPMGKLHSIAVTVDARRRRRTWYIIDPDPAVSAQYAAAGLDLTPGCKVLVDAEAMRPVALVDFDPAMSAAEPPHEASRPSGGGAAAQPQPWRDQTNAQDRLPMPHGFNPYFDLPAG